MSKEQQRDGERGKPAEPAAEKSPRASIPKAKTDPGESTGSGLAVSTTDAAIAAGEPTAADQAKHDAARVSAWLRPLQQVKIPSLHLRWPLEAKAPRIDVVSHDNDVVVRVDVSGISKDCLDLAVTSDTLTVRGTLAASDPSANYHLRELPQGEIERRIALPFEVQGDKASATLKNGLLEVVLPRSERSRQQKIAVN